MTQPDNVVQLLRDAVSRNPARPAFVAGRRAVTFEDFWSRIERASHGLLEAGFGRADRAIVMVPMSIELYVLLLSILKVGGIAAFLDPWVSFKQLVQLAKFADARAFAGASKAQLLRLIDRDLRRIPISIAPRYTPLAGTTLNKLDQSTPIDRIEIVDGEDTALITYTTGSSGVPKGVRRTHKILTAQHRALAAEFPAEEGDVDLCTFPVFALNNLALGVTTVIPPIDLARIGDADARAVIDAITTHRVTTMTASPPLIDALAAQLTRPRLRRILTGGAPVTNEQLQRWRNAFVESEIHVVYGSTEAEPVAHVSADERLSAPPRSGYLTGRMTSHVRASLVRIAKGPLTRWANLRVKEGEAGELIVTGDHVCKEYDRNDDAFRDNKIVDEEGTVWHRMGDTGYFDEGGRFWLVGRVHSTILMNGIALHAQLLEQIAMGEVVNDEPSTTRRDDRNLAEPERSLPPPSQPPLPGMTEVPTSIRRAAALAVPDPTVGERAVVIVEADHDVRDIVKQRLENAGYPGIDVVSTVQQLPLDPRHNSKIDYARLRDMFVSESLK